MKTSIQPQTFSAKLDDLSKIITYVVAAALVIPLIMMTQIAAKGNPEVLIPFAVVIIILGIALLFRVKNYVLTPDALQIVRKAGIKDFKREAFKSASPVTTKDLGFGIRLLGSGGWGGYFGTFLYRNVGKVQAFATDRKKLILLRTKDNRQILISPEDTEGFLKAMRLPQEPIQRD